VRRILSRKLKRLTPPSSFPFLPISLLDHGIDSLEDIADADLITEDGLIENFDGVSPILAVNLLS